MGVDVAAGGAGALPFIRTPCNLMTCGFAIADEVAGRCSRVKIAGMAQTDAAVRTPWRHAGGWTSQMPAA